MHVMISGCRGGTLFTGSSVGSAHLGLKRIFIRCLASCLSKLFLTMDQRFSPPAGGTAGESLDIHVARKTLIVQRQAGIPGCLWSKPCRRR